MVIDIRGGELGSDELGVAREVLRQVVSEGAEVWSDLRRSIHMCQESPV